MPGTIEKRGTNSWRITIWDGRNPDGTLRRIRDVIHFPASMSEAQQRKQCEEHKALLYAKAKTGLLVSSRQYTFREYAEMWMQDYPPTADLSPVTVRGYKDLLEGRIYAALGHIKLHQLSAQQVTRFYNKLLTEPSKANGATGKPLSASTVLHYHRLLRAMLNTAVKWGIIATNPVLKASIPKNDTKKMKVYDPETAAVLLTKLEDAPLKYHVGVVLGLLGQLRLGEIGALNWSDVDFDNSLLRIERSASAVVGQGVIIKSTKTEASQRTIALPIQAMALLRKLKAEQNEQRIQLGAAWVNSNAVLAQWNGERHHPDRLSVWFQRFLKENNLPPIRFHDLRHTGASLLMNIMGMPTQIVTNRLGHSSATVTLSFYSHGFAQKDKAAADGLEELLRAKKA